MAKRHTRHRRQRRTRRRIRKMRGGALSSTEVQQLQTYGFNQEQIDFFNSTNATYNSILQKILTIEPNAQGALQPDTISTVINEIFGDFFDNIEPIPNTDENIDMNDISFNSDNNDQSLHLSELNITNDSMDANTTLPDESFNASQMSDISMPSNFSENESFASDIGGKKRRRKSSRKTKKGKKTRKQRGGMCYGNGVGANSYDPNFSIYNTRQLELFPYRPK
jgi:hypothetical protein